MGRTPTLARKPSSVSRTARTSGVANKSVPSGSRRAERTTCVANRSSRRPRPVQGWAARFCTAIFRAGSSLTPGSPGAGAAARVPFDIRVGSGHDLVRTPGRPVTARQRRLRRSAVKTEIHGCFSQSLRPRRESPKLLARLPCCLSKSPFSSTDDTTSKRPSSSSSFLRALAGYRRGARPGAGARSNESSAAEQLGISSIASPDGPRVQSSAGYSEALRARAGGLSRGTACPHRSIRSCGRAGGSRHRLDELARHPSADASLGEDVPDWSCPSDQRGP